MTETSEIDDAPLSEEEKAALYPIIHEKATKIFKKLVGKKKIYSRKDQLIIFNALTMALTFVQNSFFPPSARDTFADSVCNSMKASKQIPEELSPASVETLKD